MIRKIVATGLAAGSLMAGCSGQEIPENTHEVPTSVERQRQPDEAWSDALEELRTNVAQSKPMKLFVAEGACVAWPAGDYKTLVKSPVVYIQDTGGDEIYFFPFVAQMSDGRTLIMNGPMQFTDGEQIASDFHAVTASPGLTFDESAPIQHYALNSDSEHSWLEADGRQLMDTRVVQRDMFAQALVDHCPDAVLVELSASYQSPDAD